MCRCKLPLAISAVPYSVVFRCPQSCRQAESQLSAALNMPLRSSQGSCACETRNDAEVLSVYGTQESICNCSEDYLPRTFSSPALNAIHSKTPITVQYLYTAVGSSDRHNKPWSPFDSFNDACRSCQSGMWLRHTEIVKYASCRAIRLLSKTPAPNAAAGSRLVQSAAPAAGPKLMQPQQAGPAIAAGCGRFRDECLGPGTRRLFLVDFAPCN